MKEEKSVHSKQIQIIALIALIALIAFTFVVSFELQS
jgi:hypothetical protein